MSVPSFPFSAFASDGVALLGYGVSNRAVHEYLLRTCPSLAVTVYVPSREMDALKRRNPSLSVDEIGGELKESVLFRSPSVRPDAPFILRAVSRGAFLTSETELFLSLCPCPVYGVTGSDGKTTTATMAYELCTNDGIRTWLGGNIGQSLLPHLSEMLPTDRAILELSSFQLMAGTFPLDAALLLNITENHLNWHRDMTEYREAKEQIFRFARRRIWRAEDAHPAYSPDAVFSARQDAVSPYPDIPFYHLRGDALSLDETPVLPRSEMRLRGRHNAENLLAAWALTSAPPSVVAEVARTFSGVEHRMQTLGEYHGATCIDSSIDTTPSRSAVTIRSLASSARLTVLCGGAGKGLSPAPLTDALLACAYQVVFTGGNGESLMEDLLSHRATGALPHVRYIPSFDEAVLYALSLCHAGDVLLLSPAATSFDFFSDYGARGRRFHELVSS